MSRFTKLALVLSSVSATAAACPGPVAIPAAPTEAKAKPAPEPEYEEVQLMTRAGPKWVKVEKQKPRVVKQAKPAAPHKPVATRSK